MKLLKNRAFLILFALIILLIAGGTLYAARFMPHMPIKKVTGNPYTLFVFQAYDRIASDYWQSPAEYSSGTFGGLPGLFRGALEKTAPGSSPVSSKDDLKTALDELFAKPASENDRERLAATIVARAVESLWPHTTPSRNSLNVSMTEQKFQDILDNRHPERDRYDALGLADNLKETYSPADIRNALVQKENELQASTSPEAASKLQEAKNSYAILSDQNAKKRYDARKQEPTVSSKIISNTLYIKISQNASQTADEFKEVVESAVAKNKNLDSMILDLRGNEGGFDLAAATIVGYFAGPDAVLYAAKLNKGVGQFVTSNEKLPALARFTSGVVLTDNRTKSTGELMSQALRRLVSFKLVGQTTAGWGTLENAAGFPLESSFTSGNTYVLRLVTGATLTDAGTLIEGSGVHPDIDTGSISWKNDVKKAFPRSSFADAITAIDNL